MNIVHIQVKSPNVEAVFFPYHKGLLLKEIIHPRKQLSSPHFEGAHSTRNIII